MQIARTTTDEKNVKPPFGKHSTNVAKAYVQPSIPRTIDIGRPDLAQAPTGYLPSHAVVTTAS